MNIESIIQIYLKNHPAVTAITDRVVMKPPPKKTTAWVEMNKLDELDDPNVSVEWFKNYMISFNCYAGSGRDPDGQGGGPPEAIALAAATRAALKELEDTVTGGAVIKKVKLIGGPRHGDEAFDREQLTAVIYAHPAGSS
jgi:hypothetical protein